jgi:hypothetical protein
VSELARGLPRTAEERQVVSRRRTRGPVSRLTVLYAVALTVGCTVLYLPLLSRVGFHSHETMTPYLRLLEYLGEMRAGHWLPQVFPHAFEHAGYAFPRFYPPLGNAVAAAFTVMTGDVVLGVHLSFLASVVLSCLTMYAVLYRITGRRSTAALAALAYVSSAYRFGDVFVRGALAECWSFAWYPPILLGLWRLQETGRVRWYLLVCAAALLLSHPQMALFFAMALLVLVLCQRPWPSGRQVIGAGAAAVWALGVTAWYWLPQQYYLPSVWASVPAAVWADRAFLVGQAVPWQTAFSGQPLRNGLDLSVGCVGVGALLLVAYGWWRPPRDPGDLQLMRRARWLLVPWLLLLGFMLAPGLAMRVLPAQFGYIQFPWRVLGPMTFFAAASLACSVVSLRAGWVGAVAVFAVVLEMMRGGVAPNERPSWTAANFERFLVAGRPRGLTGASEYLPRTVAGLDRDYEGTLTRLSGSIRAAPSASGGITVQSFIKDGSGARVAFEGATGGVIVLPHIYYDLYVARDSGGMPVATRDTLGLLALEVGPGHNVVEVREELTPVYWVGLLMSLVVLPWVLLPKFIRERRATDRGSGQ